MKVAQTLSKHLLIYKKTIEKGNNSFLLFTILFFCFYCCLCFRNETPCNSMRQLQKSKSKSNANSLFTVESALSSQASSQALHFETNLTAWESQLAGGKPVGCNLYKRSRGVEPRTTWNKSSWWSELDLNSGSPDFKPGTLTTRPRCLKKCNWINSKSCPKLR